MSEKSNNLKKNISLSIIKSKYILKHITNYNS